MAEKSLTLDRRLRAYRFLRRTVFRHKGHSQG
jgi:hypothetical protein